MIKQSWILLKTKFLSINSSELKSRLMSGALWSSLGGIVSRGFILFAFVIVARNLGQELYGEFGIIRSTVNMFVIFAGFGLGITATKHIAEYKNSNPKRASRILALSGVFAFSIGFLIALSVFISAPWLSKSILKAPQLADDLQIGALILWLSALNGVQVGALVGFEAFRTIAKINILISLVSVVSLTLGTYLEGINGAVLALAFNISISWVIHNYALRNEAKKYSITLFTKDFWKEKSILFGFSLPATIGGLMVSPVLWICSILLINQPNGFNNMAVFDVSNQWFIAILFIPSLIGKIVLPILSSFNGKEDKNQYIKVLKFSLLINGSIALIVALIVSSLSPWILGTYGEGFSNGYMVLVYLSFSAVLVSINNVVGQVITSKGRMWTGLLLNIVWAISMLIFSWYFVTSGYGAEGLAIAYLISYTIHTFSQLIYIKLNWKKFNIGERDV